MKVKFKLKNGETKVYEYDHRKYYKYDPGKHKQTYTSKKMTPEEGINYYTSLYPEEKIHFDTENSVFFSDSGRYFSMFKTYGEINSDVFINKLLTPEEGIEYYSKLYPGEEIRYNEEYDIFVSDQGNIFSRCKKRGKRAISKNNNGYVVFNSHHKKIHTTVHKLVMKTFGKYIEGMDIDHINGIRDDNRLCNLQMLSHSDNLKKRKKTNDKAVKCIELNKTFKSVKEAANEMGCSLVNISLCANGKTKSACGYHWRYADE